MTKSYFRIYLSKTHIPPEFPKVYIYLYLSFSLPLPHIHIKHTVATFAFNFYAELYRKVLLDTQKQYE